MKRKIIAVDFDGVICENKYPEIGRPKEDIINALKEEVVFNKSRLILWTCRSGKHLDNAISFCKEKGLVFDAVNDNLSEMVDKYQNNSRKIVADEYWDDRAISDIYISKKVKRQNRKSLLTVIGLLFLSAIIMVTSVIGIINICKDIFNSNSKEIDKTKEPEGYECFESPIIKPSPEEYMPVNYIKDIPLTKDTQVYLFDICNDRGLDPSIVLAVIDQESRFTSDAVSGSNDYGLMQINKCNHKWLSSKLGIDDFLDPIENINAGTYLLSVLANKYSDPNKVLMAYNMGECGASTLWTQGIYKTKYSSSVMEKSALYKNKIKGEKYHGNK